MRIALGCDHAGFSLKEEIKTYLKRRGYKVRDFGTTTPESCDYPQFAYKVAKSVAAKSSRRGILVCKTGIGNSIVANKIPGIRAALCYNIKAARLSRQHNDANILVLGEDFVSLKAAKAMIKIWLKERFSGGRHLRRLKQVREIEKRYMK